MHLRCAGFVYQAVAGINRIAARQGTNGIVPNGIWMGSAPDLTRENMKPARMMSDRVNLMQDALSGTSILESLDRLSEQLGEINAALPSLELGSAPTCHVCEAEGGCTQVQIDDQKNTNAYIWALETCGKYTFAASLDLSGMVAQGVRRLLPEGLRNPALPDEVQALVEGLLAIVVGKIFDDTIHRNDFGFDLHFAETEKLYKGDCMRTVHSVGSDRTDGCFIIRQRSSISFHGQ